MEKESGYERCCKDCTPCKTCFAIYPQGPDHCQLRECASCSKLVCCEKIHQILDCKTCEAPSIHDLKDYFVFLRDQLLELKLQMLEVENTALRSRNIAEYAERGVDYLENKMDSVRNRYY